MQTTALTLIIVVLALLAVAILGTVLLYHHWNYERLTNSENISLPGITPHGPNFISGVVAISLESVALLLFILTWPLRVVHDIAPFRASKRHANPIVLVHGWGANSACFLFVQCWLKLRGYHNVYAVSCSPAVIDARKLSAQLARHIDAALAATGAQQVTLIGHSMGGLLSRYAIRNLNCETKVSRVITIGSPHRGSKVASVIPAFGNITQMRYQSKFIQELAEGGMSPGSNIKYHSIYSEFDNFVLPAHSSLLDERAEHIHVAYHGHCALLFSPVVMRLIEARLGSPEAAAGNTP